MLTPRLPQGYHAQPAFHHQEGWTSFDFFRVYTPEREHDPWRSFWLVTTAEDTRGPQPPKTRWVAFVDWANANHKDELDYADFSNPQTPLDEVRRWVDATPSGDLVKIAELQ
jgi:hypothetical protein